jgi:hypothetical protein
MEELGSSNKFQKLLLARLTSVFLGNVLAEKQENAWRVVDIE